MIQPQVLDHIAAGENSRIASSPKSPRADKGANVEGRPTKVIRHTHREEVRPQRLSYTIRSSCGAVYFRSRTFKIPRKSEDGIRSSNDHYEFETYFTWHPAPWLMYLGIRFGVNASISKSYRGWRNTLHTFTAVPDDSLIFDFCKAGNIAGVQTLLTKGRASVTDTNTQGRTPLHVSECNYERVTSLALCCKLRKLTLMFIKIASWKCDVELCRLLLDSGADDKALTYDFIGGNYEIW